MSEIHLNENLERLNECKINLQSLSDFEIQGLIRALVKLGFRFVTKERYYESKPGFLITNDTKGMSIKPESCMNVFPGLPHLEVTHKEVNEYLNIFKNN